MSKNRSNASLKKLLRDGYFVSIGEPQVGTYHVVVRDGITQKSVEAVGASIGTACSEVLKKLEAGT